MSVGVLRTSELAFDVTSSASVSSLVVNTQDSEGVIGKLRVTVEALRVLRSIYKECGNGEEAQKISPIY